MGNPINTFSELKEEREKLKQEAEEQWTKTKNSFTSVQEEGKMVLINKILIPAGIALVAGYGLKKLVNYLNSEEERPPRKMEPSAQPSASVGAQHSSRGQQGLLSRINWSGLAVQLVPFIVNVGKKMYEDGQLPYFNPPEEQTDHPQ